MLAGRFHIEDNPAVRGLPRLVPSAAGQSDRPISSPEGARLLVMDDQDIVRGVVCRMLARLGYNVEGVGDGHEALSVFSKAHGEGRPFAAVILDLTVPGGLGGLATLSAMREIDPGVRAIASTGQEVGDGVELRSHGFQAVLCKPYRMHELASVTARLSARD
jgi:two-component system, cell cycle sensor histidine kinase and response regulator CckA